MKRYWANFIVKDKNTDKPLEGVYYTISCQDFSDPDSSSGITEKDGLGEADLDIDADSDTYPMRVHCRDSNDVYDDVIKMIDGLQDRIIGKYTIYMEK